MQLLSKELVSLDYREQLQRDLVIRDADTERSATDRMKDHRQRSGPPPPDHRLRACVDVNPTLQLRFRSSHEDERHPDGPAFDHEDAPLGDVITGRSPQAVDGVGGKGDDPSSPQQLRSAGQALVIWCQDHASTTRA